jgi:hypothetical protein
MSFRKWIKYFAPALIIALISIQAWGFGFGFSSGGGGKSYTVTLTGTSFKGNYAAGTTYSANDVVLYTTDGINYVALAGSNTGHTPSSSATWWQPLLLKGDPGANGTNGATGATGATVNFQNYTGHPASSSEIVTQIGGLKTINGTSVVGSGDITINGGSGGGGGLATTTLSGSSTIRNGNFYVATATGRWTFRNHSTGQTAIFANMSGRIIPDAATSKFRWVHPSTFASYTTSAGYSVKVPANTRVDIASLGDGKFQATLATQPLVKTGVNEFAGSGGGGADAQITAYFNADSLTATQSPTKGTVSSITVGASATSTTGIVGGAINNPQVGWGGGSVIITPTGNIDYTAGTVGFAYHPVTNVASRIMSVSTDTSQNQFQLYDDGTGFTTFQYRGGTPVVLPTNLVSGSTYYIELAFNQSGTKAAARVNGGSWSGEATDCTGTTPTGNLEFLGASWITASGNAANGWIDQVIISNTYKKDIYAIRTNTSF